MRKTLSLGLAAAVALSVGLAAGHGHELLGDLPQICAVCQLGHEPAVAATPATAPTRLDAPSELEAIDVRTDPSRPSPVRLPPSRAPPA